MTARRRWHERLFPIARIDQIGIIDHDLQPVEKPPLEPHVLADVIDLSLWAGQLMLASGAETEQIEETVHVLGTGLGAAWMDILISPAAVAVTTVSGGEFRTKIRRVVAIHTDLNIITRVNSLSRQVAAGRLDRVGLRAALAGLNEADAQLYPFPLRLFVAGSACAAFSQLFGGDGPAFLFAFIGGVVGYAVRTFLSDRYFNPYLIVFTTTFTAAMISGLAARVGGTASAPPAIASAVLLLVPGVHLVNAAEDLIKGHMVMGIVRGVLGLLISLSIAFAILLALSLTGLELF
jgi:uncharacterized membrane protein YjjP (DUF1212 family)